MTDRCRSCGAEIIWAEIDDKRIPLNKRRVRAYEELKGKWSCLEAGDLSGLHPASPSEGTLSTAPHLVHISHFITCTHPERHSRGSK